MDTIEGLTRRWKALSEETDRQQKRVDALRHQLRLEDAVLRDQYRELDRLRARWTLLMKEPPPLG